MDSLETIFKAILFHNGNVYPSIPTAYGRKQGETYDFLKIFSEESFVQDITSIYVKT